MQSIKWEEEYKILCNKKYKVGEYYAECNWVKDFIRQTLESQKQELIDKVREMCGDDIIDENILWTEEERKLMKEIYGEAYVSQCLVRQKIGHNNLRTKILNGLDKL
jgi:hypothetical protein